MLEALDARAVRRWAATALAALGRAREEIDALNVFPVPDGDTGTNLYLTFESACAAVTALPEHAQLHQVIEAFARGALLGARGNSGIITAQFLRGWADVMAERGSLDAPATREALARADAQAWAAVDRPVEGTILSVSRAAAEAAQEAPDQLGDLISIVTSAAREALARTPEQLETLRRAGVVDAGGRGLVVLLDTLEDLIHGRTPSRASRGFRRPNLPVPNLSNCPELSAAGPGYEVMYLLDAADPAASTLRARLAGLGGSLVMVGGGGLWHVHVHTDDPGAVIEAGVEVGRPYRIRITHFAEQFEAAHVLAAAQPVGAAALSAVFGALPTGLGALPAGPVEWAAGSADGTGEWPPVAARPSAPELPSARPPSPAPSPVPPEPAVAQAPAVAEASAVAQVPAAEVPTARPTDTPAARLPASSASLPGSAGPADGVTPAVPAEGVAPAVPRTGVVACAAGPGLAHLFASAGAQVVQAGAGCRPATAHLLDAVYRTRARSVVVLPNDEDTLAVAEAAARAAREAGVRVTVLPTRAQVQGLAALAVHDPGRGFDDDVVRMSAAAGAARDGAVTVAVRDAITVAGPCRQGDALGVIQGDFAVVGDDLAEVALEVVRRLLSGGGELVTLVRGQGADDALVDAVTGYLRRARRDVEVCVLDGAQPRYPLLIGVE